MKVGRLNIQSVVQFPDGTVMDSASSNAMRGGYHTVDTIAERDAIPVDRIEEGMLVLVREGAEYTSYMYKQGAWALIAMGSTGYRHTQTLPAETWEVIHSLPSHIVNVTAVDDLGQLMEGSVSFQQAPSYNVVLIKFNSPRSGRAYLS